MWRELINVSRCQADDRSVHEKDTRGKEDGDEGFQVENLREKVDRQRAPKDREQSDDPRQCERASQDRAVKREKKASELQLPAFLDRGSIDRVQRVMGKEVVEIGVGVRGKREKRRA